MLVLTTLQQLKLLQTYSTKTNSLTKALIGEKLDKWKLHW